MTETPAEVPVPRGTRWIAAIVLIVVVLILGLVVKSCGSGESARSECARQFRNYIGDDREEVIDECVRLKEADG